VAIPLCRDGIGDDFMSMIDSYFGWTEIGPAVHPIDDEGGYVYLLLAVIARTTVGVEILRTATGTIRSLPLNWREKQPKTLKGLQALSANLSRLER
jgi:hypothetical protein